jgi:hypothetical protein
MGEFCPGSDEAQIKSKAADAGQEHQSGDEHGNHHHQVKKFKYQQMTRKNKKKLTSNQTPFETIYLSFYLSSLS